MVSAVRDFVTRSFMQHLGPLGARLRALEAGGAKVAELERRILVLETKLAERERGEGEKMYVVR